MKKKGLESDTQRLINLAIKVPSIVNFEEIKQINPVKAMEKWNKDLFEFFNLFIKDDSQNF